MTPFRRDGHLTDLAIDRILDTDPLAASEDHIRTCTACQTRISAADAVLSPRLQFPTNASKAVTPQARQPANRQWLFGLIAAAAALLLVLNTSTKADDGFRLKGTGLSLQVFREEGGTSVRLHSGDDIHPGDRLGFRVRNRSAGYLMVVGMDGSGESYLYYPQEGGGAAQSIASNLTPVSLPEAIQMDDVLGEEHLIAVVCDAPFMFEEVETTLRSGDLLSGCSSTEITLVKR